MSDINQILPFKELEYDISIFHLKRTGSHGIINWIFQQLDNDNTLFINSVGKFIDGIGNSTNDLYNLDNDKIKKFHLKDNYSNLIDDEKIRNIIYSFEEQHSFSEKNLKKIPFLTNEGSLHENKIGSADKKINILILRDPYNCYSSRLSKGGLSSRYHPIYGYYAFKKMWLFHAKEFLDITNYFNIKDRLKICISYNKWFCDKEYRRKISKKIGFEFTDKGINQVRKFGGGSSFNQTDFDKKAQKMDVLERWRKNKNHPLFKKLLKDKEIHYYSEKIFGKVIKE